MNANVKRELPTLVAIIISVFFGSLILPLLAATSRIDSDMHITGAFSCGTMAIPDGTIVNADFAAAADVDSTKLEHQYTKVYAQESATTAAAEDRCLHTVYGATGTVVGFEAGSVTVCTVDAAITVDLHKDGTTILTTPIVLDSGNSVYTPEAGTVSSASVVDGDVLEVVITVAAGGGVLGDGVYCSLIVREDAD
jgi:hypothetical protein